MRRSVSVAVIKVEVGVAARIVEGSKKREDSKRKRCVAWLHLKCNSGKSDKLIKEFTTGYSKEEWSEQIRSKRASILRERRERLDEIRQHWMESLGRRSLSERDNTAVYSFIERYEPDWIKAAIGIAARKGIQYYINYTGAILSNWAKEGPPEYLSNPDAGLAKKPATPKQITYIASLLERAGLSLNDFCDKTEFDQLTMLDASTLR